MFEISVSWLEPLLKPLVIFGCWLFESIILEVMAVGVIRLATLDGVWGPLRILGLMWGGFLVISPLMILLVMFGIINFV